MRSSVNTSPFVRNAWSASSASSASSSVGSARGRESASCSSAASVVEVRVGVAEREERRGASSRWMRVERRRRQQRRQREVTDSRAGRGGRNSRRVRLRATPSTIGMRHGGRPVRDWECVQQHRRLRSRARSRRDEFVDGAQNARSAGAMRQQPRRAVQRERGQQPGRTVGRCDERAGRRDCPGDGPEHRAMSAAVAPDSTGLGTFDARTFATCTPMLLHDVRLWNCERSDHARIRTQVDEAR